jgi:hypothetical protein
LKERQVAWEPGCTVELIQPNVVVKWGGKVLQFISYDYKEGEDVADSGGTVYELRSRKDT